MLLVPSFWRFFPQKCSSLGRDPSSTSLQGMLGSGGTPDFMVDDESFEASAKKPLVEALVESPALGVRGLIGL